MGKEEKEMSKNVILLNVVNVGCTRIEKVLSREEYDAMFAAIANSAFACHSAERKRRHLVGCVLVGCSCARLRKHGELTIEGTLPKLGKCLEDAQDAARAALRRRAWFNHTEVEVKRALSLIGMQLREVKRERDWDRKTWYDSHHLDVDDMGTIAGVYEVERDDAELQSLGPAFAIVDTKYKYATDHSKTWDQAHDSGNHRYLEVFVPRTRKWTLPHDEVHAPAGGKTDGEWSRIDDEEYRQRRREERREGERRYAEELDRIRNGGWPTYPPTPQEYGPPTEDPWSNSGEKRYR